jgi:protein arginine N-methyltransferase 5
MWRQTDDRKVWYEWAVEVFVSSASPNGKKKRSKIVGSEIHSSRANGCLM